MNELNQNKSSHKDDITSGSRSTDSAPAYPLPEGVSAIPPEQLDLRADAEIDSVLLNPPQVRDEKNIWFFWHSGFSSMHPYAQRTVRAWHRRFSKQGWIIRVLDREPSSPLNVANFLDVHDTQTFPQAFIDGTICGDHALQHTSDLVRWPLLLKYGGAYADVGLIQIGDFDAAWNATVGDSNSPYEVLSYTGGTMQGRTLSNYFLASGRDNPLFARCHKLLLAVWGADGGKTSTDGMHANPLLKGVPLMNGVNLESDEHGLPRNVDELTKMLTDYIIQAQVMSMVMGLVDEEDDWDGPKYVEEHVYAIDLMTGSQLINELTEWNGARQFELMSLSLPREGEVESEDQSEARKIVEKCLRGSFGFKLAHGIIIKVMGDTLGSLWRKHEGSDDVVGTYAHWLRYGTIHWCQESMPPRGQFDNAEPYKRGPLLREV